MNVDFFICTYRKDFPYLEWCLKSVAKFATGFSGLKLLVPNDDVEEATRLTQCGIPFPAQVIGYKEWEGRGMTHHMRQIVYADTFTDADWCCHIDADCILLEHCTPETFMRDGKPILQYEPFSIIGKRHEGVLEWQRVTERCLPFRIKFETMRGHGMCLPRCVYSKTREQIERKVNASVDAYLHTVKNDYPNGFCEFVTLGNVAMEFFRDKFYLVNNSDKPNPERSDFPVGQFWSHAPLDQSQHIWWLGEQHHIVPIDMIKKVMSGGGYQPTEAEVERMSQ
jgi:hypothetical protein